MIFSGTSLIKISAHRFLRVNSNVGAGGGAGVVGFAVAFKFVVAAAPPAAAPAPGVLPLALLAGVDTLGGTGVEV